VTSVAAASISVATDNVPGITTTGNLTLGLTPASSLSVGSTIVYTIPANYLSSTIQSGVMTGASISTASATVTCTLYQASLATSATAAIPSTIGCITAGAAIPAAAIASVTFGPGTWTLRRGAAGTYTATTYNNIGQLVDRASAPGTLISAIGGAVSKVEAAVFSALTDTNPGLAATTGTLKVELLPLKPRFPLEISFSFRFRVSIRPPLERLLPQLGVHLLQVPQAPAAYYLTPVDHALSALQLATAVSLRMRRVPIKFWIAHSRLLH
jgi:hypothetical protein